MSGQPQGFLWHLCHVRSAHDDGNSGPLADSCRHLVGPLRHSRHEAHPHKIDLILDNEIYELVGIKVLSVPVYNADLMSVRRQSLQHEGPKLRNEIICDLIVRNIQKDMHLNSLLESAATTHRQKTARGRS